MTTVLEIITDAMQDAGIIGSNETPDATDGQKALRLLTRMLDGDSTESLMIYNNVQEVFNLVSGQMDYTIGIGGDFNTTRPVNITQAFMRDTNGNDLPVKILTYDEYGAIIAKTVQSSIAFSLYYNSGSPLSTITFWPVVSGSTYRLVLWSWKQLDNVNSLSDVLVFPPGYEDYIESNLAVRLCMAFNRPVPPELIGWATEAKSKLKRINVFVPTLGLPAELVGNINDCTFPISPHILTGY